jgi:hypothetical protein
MRTTIKLCFLLFLLYSSRLFGQITLNMPLERSVFQRVNNEATIQVGGATSMFLDKLQARLIPLNGGEFIDWININTHVAPGAFRGQVPNVKAGWYRLEIRGFYDNLNQITYNEVEKVGVGEVFIVSGQSNAQGGRNNDGFATQIYYGANDDRVNGINWSTDDVLTTYPLPVFEKIQPETDIAPTGKASWCWGLLGDRIAQEWNVPVVFFNAAIGATTIGLWSSSINNNSYPYIYLKNALQYYTKIYGARALLWHQGESDIFNFDTNMPTSAQNYTTNLGNVINASRADIGSNLSWVISKVSMLAGYTSPALVQCQENNALLPNSNRFLGPYTDPIQPLASDRDELVHFRGQGFIYLADAWFNSINNANFLANSHPIAPVANIKVVGNQFEFGNSLAPCYGQNQTISSGDWNNPVIWSCGVVPISINDIVINAGHTITIDAATIYVKSLTMNGEINLINGGTINMVDY